MADLSSQDIDRIPAKYLPPIWVETVPRDLLVLVRAKVQRLGPFLEVMTAEGMTGAQQLHKAAEVAIRFQIDVSRFALMVRVCDRSKAFAWVKAAGDTEARVRRVLKAYQRADNETETFDLFPEGG